MVIIYNFIPLRNFINAPNDFFDPSSCRSYAAIFLLVGNQIKVKLRFFCRPYILYNIGISRSFEKN